MHEPRLVRGVKEHCHMVRREKEGRRRVRIQAGKERREQAGGGKGEEKRVSSQVSSSRTGKERSEQKEQVDSAGDSDRAKHNPSQLYGHHALAPEQQQDREGVISAEERSGSVGCSDRAKQCSSLQPGHLALAPEQQGVGEAESSVKVERTESKRGCGGEKTVGWESVDGEDFALAPEQQGGGVAEGSVKVERTESKRGSCGEKTEGLEGMEGNGPDSYPSLDEVGNTSQSCSLTVYLPQLDLAPEQQGVGKAESSVKVEGTESKRGCGGEKTGGGESVDGKYLALAPEQQGGGVAEGSVKVERIESKRGSGGEKTGGLEGMKGDGPDSYPSLDPSSQVVNTKHSQPITQLFSAELEYDR